MTIRLVSAAGLLTASFATALWAQPDRPEISTALDPTVMTIGDTVRVTVSVTHASDARVVWPETLTLDPFELLDLRPVEPVPEGAGLRSSAELTVTAFELGALTLPSFEVAVLDAAGDAMTLSTAASTVTVESVGRDEGGAIRDIKGPLEIPFSAATLLPWLAGLGALGAFAYWLYRRNQRTERPDTSAPVVPPRPAHEVAYESLNALEASGLLELGEVKTYHIRISDIMRIYVEGRFGVDAMEMTTGEVLDGLRRAQTPSGVTADFRQLLDRCDLVKFAKYRPDVPACRDLVPLGRRLVDVTKPADPVPAEAPVEAPA